MQSIITNFQNWLALITDKPLYPGLEKYHTVSKVHYNSFWKQSNLNPLRREQNNPAWRDSQLIIERFEEIDEYDLEHWELLDYTEDEEYDND